MAKSSADKAVAHVLKRMREDGQIGYLLGCGTMSYELLTQAYADAHGLDVQQFRRDFDAASVAGLPVVERRLLEEAEERIDRLSRRLEYSHDAIIGGNRK